jgi:hypothetical protein
VTHQSTNIPTCYGCGQPCDTVEDVQLMASGSNLSASLSWFCSKCGISIQGWSCKGNVSLDPILYSHFASIRADIAVRLAEQEHRTEFLRLAVAELEQRTSSLSDLKRRVDSFRLMEE